ncbi:MAG: Spx/MgsR family RNA polymerase-binding regulatory protein [Pseudohongiellaceae bacterium]
MITLFGISNCDTIKKTRKVLDTNNIEYTFHDYKKLGCPTALVKDFLEQFSHTELINTRGTTWRKIDSEAKENLSATTAIALISDNPSMIKRPLIQTETEWILGFDEEKLKSLAV